MNILTDTKKADQGVNPEREGFTDLIEQLAPSIGEMWLSIEDTGLNVPTALAAFADAPPAALETLSRTLIRYSREMRAMRADQEGRRVLVINRGSQMIEGDVVTVLNQVTAAGAELSFTSASRNLAVGAKWGDDEFQFEVLGNYEVLTRWSDESGSHMMVAEVLA
ncbi:MAG: hypothetical protein ABWX92_17120 [Mycetocola sp.]